MSLWIIILILFFALITSFKLNWGVFVILATLPSYLIRFNIGPFPTTFLEIMILIAFFTWFIKAKPWKRLKRKYWKNKKQKYPYYFEIVLILIFSWLGLLIASFNNSSLGIFKAYFIEPIMLYIVIINTSYKNIKKLIWPLSISALLISLYAFYQQFFISFDFANFLPGILDNKVSSIFEYPNALGLFLGPIILLSIGLLISYPNKTNLFVAVKKYLLIFTIIFSALAIFFARSEGAIIAILIAIFVIAILANNKSRKIAIIITTIFLIFISLNSSSLNYIENRLKLKDLSGQIRKQQWKETYKMLSDGNILLGVGLNNYQKALIPYHQEGIFVENDDPEWHRKVVWDKDYRDSVWQPVEIYLYPHNIFLNFWTEITIFGALVFIFLIFRIIIELMILIKKLNKERKALALGTIGAMIVIFIHGLVDVPYFKNDLAILFWLIVALAGIIKLKHKNKI